MIYSSNVVPNVAQSCVNMEIKKANETSTRQANQNSKVLVCEDLAQSSLTFTKSRTTACTLAKLEGLLTAVAARFDHVAELACTTIGNLTL